MDPLLSKIEALDEPDCYTLTFVLASGEQRELVLRVRDGDAGLPPRTVLPNWSATGYQAAVGAVRAMHQARELAQPTLAVLMDIDGGWDVGLGNVVLSAAGAPSCVAHGVLAQTGPGLYRCEGCGAVAGLRG